MRAVRSFAFFALLLLPAQAIAADPVSADASSPDTSATISGLVVDVSNALPIVGATVRLRQGEKDSLRTTTDANGRYRFTTVPGIYRITIRARGYAESETDDVVVLAGSTTLSGTLRQATTSAQSNLATIGRTTTSARSLSAATTISRQISVAAVTATGQIRLGDQIGTLPGVNFSTSSSVGDDASINLRGFRRG